MPRNTTVEEPAEVQLNEYEFIDAGNLEALDEAMRPVTGIFPLTLSNGKKIRIPYKVIGFAYGLEASRGEKFKENEANDPEKTKRIFMKKINMGLLEGWHVVDNIKRKMDKPSVLLANKQIPLSIITPRDWNLLNEVMFPGALDQPDTLQERARQLCADARDDAALQGIPGTGDTE